MMSHGAKSTTLPPTITMSNEQEAKELNISNKDLPKASKDQKDPTRKVEHPPLANVEFNTFVYTLALFSLLTAVYYAFQMLKLS